MLACPSWNIPTEAEVLMSSEKGLGTESLMFYLPLLESVNAQASSCMSLDSTRTERPFAECTYGTETERRVILHGV